MTFLNDIIEMFWECDESSLSDMLISQKAYKDAFELRIPNCNIMPIIEKDVIKILYKS